MSANTNRQKQKSPSKLLLCPSFQENEPFFAWLIRGKNEIFFTRIFVDFGWTFIDVLAMKILHETYCSRRRLPFAVATWQRRNVEAGNQHLRIGRKKTHRSDLRITYVQTKI